MSALSQFEANILYWIQQNVCTPALDTPAIVVSNLGKFGAFWIVLTLLLLAFKKTRTVGIYCAISMVLTLIVVNGVIKPIAGRIRPYDNFAYLESILKEHGFLKPMLREHDGCFPSGHAANAFATAWVLFRRKKKYGVPAMLLATLISLSRIYLGAHYPTDVLAGVLIGIILAEVTVRIAPPYVKRIRKAIRRKLKAKKKAKA